MGPAEAFGAGRGVDGAGRVVDGAGRGHVGRGATAA
jgi:hypothetical protein